jgi:hypothetical protein
MESNNLNINFELYNYTNIVENVASSIITNIDDNNENIINSSENSIIQNNNDTNIIEETNQNYNPVDFPVDIPVDNQLDIPVDNLDDITVDNPDDITVDNPDDITVDNPDDNPDDYINENNNNLFHFNFNEEILNETVESKHNEIMSWAYSNMMNIDDDVIKFIDYCYLKNLQYDDEPIDTIRYTIRTVFAEGLNYEVRNLISNIFSYGMIGINYVFNENFNILNEMLSLELKRILRRGMFINIFSQMILNHNGGFGTMEDIKLILTKEELDKIPVNIYKDISPELKEKKDSCTVCREEYHDNDNVRTLRCGHVFHTECVDNWLMNHSHKCPCCRQTSGTYTPNI